MASLLNNNSDFIFKKKENEYNKTKQDVSEMLSSNIDKNESENIISKLFPINEYNNDIIDENAFNDLEIFAGIDNINNSIFKTIDKTKTIFGKLYFRNCLKIPQLIFNL